LTKRKLIPSLYNLAKDNLLAKDFALIGFSRDGMSTDQWREKLTSEAQQFSTGGTFDHDLWHWFIRRVYYVSGNFDDPDAYQRLKEALGNADKEHGTRGNY